MSDERWHFCNKRNPRPEEQSLQTWVEMDTDRTSRGSSSTGRVWSQTSAGLDALGSAVGCVSKRFLHLILRKNSASLCLGGGWKSLFSPCGLDAQPGVETTDLAFHPRQSPFCYARESYRSSCAGSPLQHRTHVFHSTARILLPTISTK